MLRWDTIHPGIQVDTLTSRARGVQHICRGSDHTASDCTLAHLQLSASHYHVPKQSPRCWNKEEWASPSHSQTPAYTRSRKEKKCFTLGCNPPGGQPSSNTVCELGSLHLPGDMQVSSHMQALCPAARGP
jgi:hypothetical protein